MAAFIFYVHKNAVHHGYSQKIGNWKFDSYNSILSESKSSLLREETINFFGTKDDFINFHKQEIFPKHDFIDV